MSSTLSDSQMEEGSTTSKRPKFGHKFFSKFSKKNKENNNHGTKKKNYQSEIEKQQERARDLVASQSSTNSNHLAYSSNGSIGEYAEARSRQEMMDLAAANKGRESSYNLISLAYANSRPTAMKKENTNSTNTNTVTAASVNPATTTTTDVTAVTSSSTHSLLENITSAYANFFSRPTTIQIDETNNTNTNTTMVTTSPTAVTTTTIVVPDTTISNNNNTHPFDETIENKKKEEDKTKSASWFSGTKMFTNMCNDVFDSIDEDNSNEINEKELYTGLLLLHLQLGLYAGPAACKPLSKKNAYDLFHKLDTNQDGTLDRTEFQNVIALLMGNVITRIALQFVCTLVIVPFVATTFLFKMNDLKQFMTGTVIPLFHDEQYQSLFYEKYLPLFQMIIGWDILTKYVAENEYSQLMVDKYHGIINDVLNSNNNTVVVVTQTVTNSFQVMVDKYHELMHQIPEETWSSLPLTVVSTIVTMMILPYTIMKTDNFFQFVANKFPRKKKK
mmetsp:Transcript_25030/g.28950  ORF Transcript_25030/g.28950 Transcript_25030/m.28950 type:complete len:502 (-) Transcript_25030:250-1755(-)